MQPAFKEYLKSIGIGDTIAKRVEEIYEFYEHVLEQTGDEIKDIFITDYIEKDTTRTYQNLWFFSNKYLMEAKLFINNDDFDFFSVKGGLAYIDIKKKDYDFKNANDNSRLSVEYAVNISGGQLKASKENCDKLRDIVLTYFIPLTN